MRGFLTLLSLMSVPTALWSQAKFGRELVSIGLNGGLFRLGGQDFSVTDDALGGEANVAVRLVGRWYFSVGGHYSSHGTVVAEPLRIRAVFLEPQVVFDAGNSTVLRLGIRGGQLHRSIKVDTTTYESSGHGFGIEGAASRRIVGRLALEAAVTLDFLSFDSLFPSGSTDTGTAFAIHIGCRLGVGK